MVKGRDSRSKGRGFESRHEKEAGVGPFKKKILKRKKYN